MTRLLAPAKKGVTEIEVEKGLDLVPGDRIALSATSFAATASDQAHVVSYDNATGKVTLDSKLNHYHWGAAESTGAKYNGYDLRGEVLILSRNIKIIGEDVESWGAQVITSDTLDVNINTGAVNIRSGSTILQNVEIYNASQH
jgi:lipopolysaccharide export system protein LptA